MNPYTRPILTNINNNLVLFLNMHKKNVDTWCHVFNHKKLAYNNYACNYACT